MSNKNQINRLLVKFFVVVTMIVLSCSIFVGQKEESKEINQLTDVDRSIAVLPFVNLTNDREHEYFCDGLTDGILNSLAKQKGLKVTARTSSFKFRGPDIDLKDIGRKLGVRTILQGTFQMEGDRIRISVQLINVEDKFHFWSEQYDEMVENVFFLQDKIAGAVAEKLAIKLNVNDQRISRERHTPLKKEYALYLKGRASWNLRTPPELLKGIAFFEQAIADDPLYAEAYAGLADCYTALGYGSHLAPHIAFPKAIEAAQKALKLDSTLAEPHASLGYCRFYYDWDWAEAEQQFRIALALNHNYELAYDWYGSYLTALQRYEEAIVILKKAASLDPLSVAIQTDIGFSYYYSGNYDSALKELQTAIQMNPAFNLSRLWLSRTYQAKKMYTEAILECKTLLEIVPDWPVALAQIGSVYGTAERKLEALETLDKMKSLAPRKFVSSYALALLYAGLNENERAMSMLNVAYEERSNWLVWLKTDPRWGSLRSDKRFTELVNKVGLPN